MINQSGLNHYIKKKTVQDDDPEGYFSESTAGRLGSDHLKNVYLHVPIVKLTVPAFLLDREAVSAQKTTYAVQVSALLPEHSRD